MSADVDECSIGDNVCGSPERHCTNTPGSFNCECGPGTTKKGDNCEGCVLKLLCGLQFTLSLPGVINMQFSLHYQNIVNQTGDKNKESHQLDDIV